MNGFSVAQPSKNKFAKNKMEEMVLGDKNPNNNNNN